MNELELPAQDSTASLERELEKMKRIQQALINRVERSIDGQGSAFSLFQTAIVLEAQIKARTLALERTLGDLERSYAEAAKAREQAETARTRLLAAMEAISEGFALFDSADRLVLFNSTFLEFWPGLGDRIRTGMTFSAIVHLAVQHKCVIDAYRDPERWVRRRLEQHSAAKGTSVHALSNGRWMQVDERRMEDGGIVAAYTDITELKRGESRRREVELAKKTNLLQATLDNIFEGVAVYDRDLALVAWNNEFVRLLEIPAGCVGPQATFLNFQEFNERSASRPITNREFLHPSDGRPPLKFEQIWSDERVLEIERNPMPDGGFVLTFTDVTERKRSEEALRDGERRIRLITDAVPALISYVDAEERYQFVNERYRQWLGLGANEVLGRSLRDVLPAGQYAWRKPFIDRALQGEAVEFEAILEGGGKDTRYGHISLIPHVVEGQRILGFFSLTQDVTERRRIGEALQDANETLERRVAERTAALTKLNAQLQLEVSERKAVEEALQVAKSQAEQANLSKTRFLAAASHDLLQPLNSARLFVSALSDLEHSRQTRALIDNLDASLSAVEDLLGTLLDISKLDAGAVSPEISEFPIGTVLGPLAVEYAALARERGLGMRYVPSTAVVRSDVRLLRRIVQNFLSNAMRYTETGRILLGCRRSGMTAVVEVWDTGPGIPEDKLDEIFEEFRQLKTAPGRRDPGMGLGLAIVRRAARMLDHPIHTRSRLGSGSVFGITVPLGGTSPALRCPSAGRRNQLFSGALVLVIDDQMSILAGMEALLTGWGCDVLLAASGREALGLVKRLARQPDVVIADYHLDGGADGIKEIGALQRVCKEPLPGIIISADHGAEIRSRAKEGGYSMLKKPLNPARLRSLLGSILAARDAPRAH